MLRKQGAAMVLAVESLALFSVSKAGLLQSKSQRWIYKTGSIPVFNRPTCHLSLSSIKNNLAINSPVRKELAIFSRRDSWLKVPYGRPPLPPGPSSSDTAVLTKVSREQKTTSDSKAGRADGTRALAFWPWGHSITSTEPQEHWSKGLMAEEYKWSVHFQWLTFRLWHLSRGEAVQQKTVLSQM